MSIPVTCQCGRRLRARDSDAGKLTKCPDCGAELRIPQQGPQVIASASVYGNIKPKYCLTVTKGPQGLRESFRLRRSRVTTVGKASDNAVVLPSPMVSRHHCQISWSAKGWLLEDLKSTNGTYVNGLKIKSRRILHGDEQIKLGKFELIFEIPKHECPQLPGLDEQLKALQSGDPQTSRAAAESLAASGRHAANHLVQKFSGFDTISGHLAMEILEKIGSDAVPALVRALNDKAKLTRSSAARALGKLGPKAASAVSNLLQKLDDQDPTVYAEVTWALGQIGSAAVPGLVKALHSTKRSRLISAAWTLGRIGPEAAKALTTLGQLARHDDEEISRVAISALKKINPSHVNA